MSSIKKKDAEAFEKILTAENKTILEKLLDSIDPDSCFDATRVSGTLNAILGEEAILFITNAIAANDIEIYLNDTTLSKETQQYVRFLYAKHGYKIGKLLFNGLLNKPDEWILIKHLSTKFEFTKNELILKVVIQKANREQIVIEDTFTSFLGLFKIILGYMNETPNLSDFTKASGVTKQRIKSIEENLRKLSNLLFGEAAENKPDHEKQPK